MTVKTAKPTTRTTKPVAPKVTHVLMIADMSGSMAQLENEVRGGFNTYLDGLEKEKSKFLVSCTLFDTEFIPLFTEKSPVEATRLDEQNYRARGMTALYDAVGKTLAEFGDCPKGDKVLVVVHTDGLENSSHEFTADTLKSKIEKLEKSGDWTFLFLGAGTDVWRAAEQIGIPQSQAFNTPQTGQGTQSRYAGVMAATHSTATGASSQATAQAYASTPGAIVGDPIITQNKKRQFKKK